MDRRKTSDVLFYALNCAVNDRKSFIDAYSNMPDAPEIKEAEKDIAAFMRLRKRLFPGQKSREEAYFEQPMIKINVLEMRKFMEENPEIVITED